MLPLSSKIEGLLFYKGEPIEIKELAKTLKVSEGEIIDAVNELHIKLEGRGITLVQKDGSITLATVSELAEIIGSIRKEELTKDLSRASLETLAVILYKNGAARAEIDYIRGVNSSFILRNLSIRGLVEKIVDQKDSRRYIYRPTFELLSYLGVSDIHELPDFNNIAGTLIKEMYNEEAKSEIANSNIETNNLNSEA